MLDLKLDADIVWKVKFMLVVYVLVIARIVVECRLPQM